MFENRNLDNENIKNPLNDDEYTIVSALFFNKHEITISSLSLTILDLINKNQIKCDINQEESWTVGKKLSEKDLEVMKNIQLRIASSGELKTSESAAINLLKKMNKSKKFNLKEMLKNGRNASVANNFKKDFIKYKNSLENENEYTSKDYKDILANGKLTSKGKELKKGWGNYQKYLKSKKFTEKYPPESTDENASQIIYGACFGIEKDALELRENDSSLTDFIDKDGFKFLNIIFSNTLDNVKEKSKGDGIFYGVNDKYTVPGGG